MYYFIDSALSIFNPSKFFLVFSFALPLLSIVVEHSFEYFPCGPESFGSYNDVCDRPVFSTALVRAFHMVSDCAAICLPYSLFNSLRELSPVITIERLWIGDSSDWFERVHV